MKTNKEEDLKKNDKVVNDTDKAKSEKKRNIIVSIIVAVVVLFVIYILFFNKKNVKVVSPAKTEVEVPKKVESTITNVDQQWNKALEMGDLKSITKFVKENPQSKYAISAAGFIDFMTKYSKPLSGKLFNSKKYSVRLKGTIYNRLGYVLDLNNENGILSGSYYYTRYGSLNRGEIYGIKSGSSIKLYEKNMQGIKTGAFDCKLVDKKLTGDFFYAKSRYSKKNMSVNLSVIRGNF